MAQITMPHDHGQEIEKILDKLPTQEECAQVAEIFKQISDDKPSFQRMGEDRC